MKFERLAIPDVILVTPKRHGDARGFFSETFRADIYDAEGIKGPFVQDNLAYSEDQFVLRGLHYQIAPSAQAKLVTCTRGRIFDVAVDLRKRASTFGQHVAVELSAETGQHLYIPVGFAHGYLTLTPGSEVRYKVSAYYSPDDERALKWNDPELGVAWPLEGASPILSEKDVAAPALETLKDTF